MFLKTSNWLIWKRQGAIIHIPGLISFSGVSSLGFFLKSLDMNPGFCSVGWVGGKGGESPSGVPGSDIAAGPDTDVWGGWFWVESSACDVGNLSMLGWEADRDTETG